MCRSNCFTGSALGLLHLVQNLMSINFLFGLYFLIQGSADCSIPISSLLVTAKVCSRPAQLSLPICGQCFLPCGQCFLPCGQCLLPCGQCYLPCGQCTCLVPSRMCPAQDTCLWTINTFSFHAWRVFNGWLSTQVVLQLCYSCATSAYYCASLGNQRALISCVCVFAGFMFSGVQKTSILHHIYLFMLFWGRYIEYISETMRAIISDFISIKLMKWRTKSERNIFNILAGRSQNY